MSTTADGTPTTTTFATTSTSLTGLTPPGVLQRLTAEGWTKWKQLFEIYRVASGTNKMDDEVQVAVLLHCIGEACVDVYNTLGLTDEEKKKYGVVLKKFEDYFVPIKNESVNSHIFFTRNQEPGEMFDTYLTELKKLSIDCNFGTLKDRLIRDRIVAGILDKRVKDRLLRETDLTLEKTVKICKCAELSEQQVKKFEPTKDVASISKKSGGNSRNNNNSRTGNNTSGAQRKKMTSSTTSESCDSKQQENACQRCGYKHRFKNCPAFRRECKQCGKTGHFAKMCKNKRSIKVVDVSSENKCNDDEYNELFCNWISVDSINAREEWIQNVHIIDSKKKVAFKIDSGAECNIIPIDICKRLNIKECYRSNVVLKNYNHEKIKTLGKVNLNCKIGNIEKPVEFEIFDGKSVPIFGLKSSIDFNLIKRIIPEEENEYAEVLNVFSVNKVDNDIFKKYNDVFKGIGKIIDFQYKIELKEGSIGKVEPCRHVPFKLINKLKIEIKKMESAGIISKVEKPTDFVNSLVIVGKSDGSIRICLDPQYLNSCIKREHIQLPTIDEIAAKVKNAKYFTKLDANKAFWQIELSENSRELTTFNTPFGRYYFNRLPYGICSSPEVFYRVFNQIFENIENVGIYADDMLIWAETKEQLLKIMDRVFKRARAYGIKFNIDKSELLVSKVKYLGHILSGNGIEVDKERVESIKKMNVPKNKKELLTFLGTVNYVSKFIPNAAQLTSSLRQLTKKDVPFVWGKAQQDSFVTLRETLCSPPVLSYFDVNKPITLSVDASSEGLGCVLVQDERPVAYGSRALTETEKMYSQIEKESLAIVFGCHKFNQYLFGQKFVVETDHKPLIPIFKKPMNKIPPRVQRMRISLHNFDFELKYVPGKKLFVADHLSRSHLKSTDSSNEEKIEAYVMMVENNLSVSDVKMVQFKNETNKDNELKEVLKYVRNGWPENKAAITECVKPYFSFKEELSECNGLLLKNSSIVVPKTMRKEMLSKIHYAHFGKEKCKMLARKTVFWPGMSKQIDDVVSNCDTCCSFQRDNSKEPMIEKTIPRNPWEIVASDIFFLLGKKYIIVVDTFSKFVDIQNLNDLTTETTIQSLKEFFSRYGIPKVLYSDSGSQYKSHEFKRFSEKWGFKHVITTPKHHQSNGLAERHIQTLKRILIKIIQDGKDKEMALLQLRNMPIDKSGITPAELMFGRKVRNLIPDVNKNKINPNKFNEVLKERQNKQKRYYDKVSKSLKDFNVGDKVKIHEEGKNNAPHKSGIIIEKHCNPRSYNIKTEQGTVIIRNRKDLTKSTKFNESNHDLDMPLDEPTHLQEPVTDNELNNLCNNNVKPNVNVVPNNIPDVITTRSGRVIKKPEYLKDYVCTISFKKKKKNCKMCI